MTSTACTINDPRHAASTGADAYNTLNQLTVKGDDADYANPTYYHYDANGSLIKLHETADDPGGTTYFKYNPAMMIDSITWKDESVTQFYYDGRLQRYAMDENGSVTYFLWDGPNLLQEIEPDGSVIDEHTNAVTPIAGIGQLVETYRPQQAAADQLIYPVMDMRGSITKWLKDDGATVVAEREYEAFGTIIPGSELGTWPSRFGYQGQTWIEIQSADKQQTLLLSSARIYRPEDGTFGSRDLVDWYAKWFTKGNTPSVRRFELSRSRPKTQGFNTWRTMSLYNMWNTPPIGIDPTGLYDPMDVWCDPDHGWTNDERDKMEALWKDGWKVDGLGTEFKRTENDVWVDVETEILPKALLRGADIQWSDNYWSVDFDQKEISLDFYNDYNAAQTLRAIARHLGASGAKNAKNVNMWEGNFTSHADITDIKIKAIQNINFKLTPKLTRLIYQLGQLRWAQYGEILIDAVKNANPVNLVDKAKALLLPANILKALNAMDKVENIIKFIKTMDELKNKDELIEQIQSAGSLPDDD